MKKIILFAFLAIFSLGAFAVNSDLNSKSENTGIPEKKENKLSAEEINKLAQPVEEVRGKDNSPQTIVVQDDHRGRRHRNEMRNNHRNGGVVFIGGGAAILLIILIIILI
jgi:hypothetical protein